MMNKLLFALVAFLPAHAFAADNFIGEAKCLNALSRFGSKIKSVEQFGTATKYYHYKLVYNIDWDGGKKEDHYGPSHRQLNEEDDANPVIRMGRMKNGDSRYCSVDEQNGKLQCWLVPEDFVKKNMAKVVYVRIQPSGEVMPMEIGTKRSYLRSAPLRKLWNITNHEIKETVGTHDTYYAELLNGVFGTELKAKVEPVSVKAETAKKVAAEFKAETIPAPKAKEIFRKHIGFLFDNMLTPQPDPDHPNAKYLSSMSSYGEPTLMECLSFMEKTEDSYKKFCDKMEKMFINKCDASALLDRALKKPAVEEGENPPNDTWSAE